MKIDLVLCTGLAVGISVSDALAQQAQQTPGGGAVATVANFCASSTGTAGYCVQLSPTGIAPPAYALQMGFINSLGNLVIPSLANPLPTTAILGVTSSAPTEFTASFTTTAAAVSGLPPGAYKRISFAVQGTGSGCYSFFSATPSISGSTCTNGYPIASGGAFNSAPNATPNTQLYIIESSSSTLTLVGDFQ